MRRLITIIKKHQYQMFYQLKNLMPHLSRCLIKTIGVDYGDENEKQIKRIKEGKRKGKRVRTSIYPHLFRRIKQKLNTKKLSHENEKSF